VRPRRHRGRVIAVAVGWGVLSAAPAAAHPFGPPPTARISAQGATVSIAWSATPDDAVAIGESLGVMPPGSVAAYRQEGGTQVAPSSADEARFSASPLLREYLIEHIAVSQAGQPCAASVPAIGDFVHAGARIDLTCPAPVTTVDLRISMLHEIHEAYRTVAIGTGSEPRRSVFTVSAPEHTWTFGAGGGGTAPWLGAGIVTATVALAGAAFVLARRRQRT
jgi:hypothetical protein